MMMRRVVAPLGTLLLVAAACEVPRIVTPTTNPTTAAATATAAPPPPFEGKTLDIVTGATGGVYILYGAALADVLTKKMKVAARAQSTAGSVANLQLMRDGKADLAFTFADTAYDALKGQNTFKPEEKVDVRALAVLYSSYTHVVVKDGAGINTIADLQGRRVSMGAAASGTEIIADRILEAYGLDPAKDIRRERLGVADAASALRDGKIDAFFWSGGLPTPQVSDLATSTRLKFLDHSDAITKMADTYGPFYFPIKIPKGTYRNDADIVTSGVANLLVVPAKLDPALAQAILKALFDGKAELAAARPEANDLTLASAIEGSPLDFHPGAIEFYRAMGVWKK